jgi:alanyl-tRNA synthetase
VTSLEAGSEGVVVLDKSPFYGESGGQVGDTGSLDAAGTKLQVRDTQKASGLHLHHVLVSQGALHVGDVVAADVDSRRRAHTKRNHTATHLLHAALRQVLGEHVTQKGSLVAPERLRFDFSHHRPVTTEQLVEIERIVNERILSNVGLETTVRSFDDAREAGAMALFGEKYDDEVRVVDVPGFSIELCGGTHVDRTGDIGLFRITSEGGVAGGVRRIEAQTGLGALAHVRQRDEILQAASASLKTSPSGLVDSVRKLQDDRKAAERRADQLEAKLASAAASEMGSDATTIDGIKVLVTRFDGDLKAQADSLRSQLGSSVIFLASEKGGKAVLLAAATKDIAPKRVHAGNLIKAIAPLVDGRGGGRPDMAQAGGKNPAGIDEALAAAREAITAALGG